MPEFKEKIYSNYKAKQLYDMVKDIEKYPEFLPWCSAAKILTSDSDSIKADLVISYNKYSLSYTSLVKLITFDENYHNCAINVEAIAGPFKYLMNKWSFIDSEQGGCEVIFFIDFAFESILFEKLVGGFLENSLTKMVGAFEKRAKKLYG